MPILRTALLLVALVPGLIHTGNMPASDAASVGSPDQTVSRDILARAVTTWNQVLGKTAFRLSNGVEQADIEVRKAPQSVVGTDAQGTIMSRLAVDGAAIAEVNISSVDDSRPISDLAVQCVLTHELGHYLGLEDETGKGGVMDEFDADHLVVRPTRDEVSEVRQIQKTDSEKALKITLNLK